MLLSQSLLMQLATLTSAGLFGASLVDGLILPSPLSSAHSILHHRDARHGRPRHSVSVAPAPSSAPFTKQRSGHDRLNGPLNVMSMEPYASTHDSSNIVPDPINVTNLVDPSALDVLDLNWVAEVAAHVEAAPGFVSLSGAVVSSAVIEEEIVVVESPEDEALKLQLQPTKEREDYPSIMKIIKFSLPAIGVWLCSPVLSMIDTASVGLLAGTAQQAALNPAVSVTDYGALLVAFMYTATTNLIAGAVEKDAADAGVTGNNQRRTKRTLVTALRLALVVGVTFGAILGTAAPFLLRMLIGNSTLDPTVFQSALRYVQIRSLGMPAAVVIGTAQSACLGMQDVKSPLYVLAAAAGINLMADILLVPNLNPWLGGAAGAAWATVFSQYGALLMFMRWITLKNKKNALANNDETMDPMEMIKDSSKEVGKTIKVTVGNAVKKGIVLRKNLFSSNKSNATKEVALNESKDALAKGFLSDSHKPLSALNPFRLPKSISTIKKFLPFVVPVTTTSIGRVSGFLTMSHVASSALGTYDMAAHQIAISLFCCLSPVVDALNQVAQSFVPGIFARKKSRARALALRKTSINFAKVGLTFGLGIAALITMGGPALSGCFTTDPIVLSRVKKAIPGIAVFLGFDGIMCIAEGSLLGQNDLKFLRNMYAAFFFLVPSFMLRLKRRALSGIEVGIGEMWGTFSVYEVVRAILWLGRLIWLQRKTEQEVDEMEGATA